MRSAPPSKLLLSLGLWAVLAGCGTRIPPSLASQVAWNLSFPEVRRQPEAYVGRIVAFGGIITQIDAVDEGHRAVVMEVTVLGEGLGKGKTSAAEGAEEAPLLEKRHIHVWGASWWPRIQIGMWG